MSNTEKLLRAFIVASGYKVEETETITLDGVPLPKPSMKPGAFIPVEASDIRSIIRVVDYKVTKRQHQLQEDDSASMLNTYLFGNDPYGINKFTSALWAGFEKKSLTLDDGAIYRFNYKSKTKAYDDCVMTYNKSLDKFTCFRFQLDLNFCTDIKKVADK